MLISLSIRNIVIIDKLELSFQAGLCIISGETGAGKSIILDALGLALGRRGDAGLVRKSCRQGVATACFAIREGHPVEALLVKHGQRNRRPNCQSRQSDHFPKNRRWRPSRRYTTCDSAHNDRRWPNQWHGLAHEQTK